METIELIETETLGVVKLSVTDTAIAQLKADYMGLTINGIEDKEGLKRVYEARQHVKKTRTSLVKEADALKEKALAWQRKVNSEKNRIVPELEAIESYLQAQEDKIEAAKEELRKEKERQEEARIQARIDALAPYGVSIELVFLKTISDSDFSKLVDRAKLEFEKEQEAQAELKRIEDEAAAERLRLQKIEEDRIKAEREELEKLRAHQAEAQRVIDAENEKIRLEKEELLRQKISNRYSELSALGMKFNPAYGCYALEDVNVDNATEICLLSDEEWDELVKKITPVIADRKKAAEEKRLHQIELAKQEALRIQAEKEEAERIANAEKLAQSSDKVKFQSVIDYLQKVEFPEMKSKKAKALAVAASGLIQKTIEHIKAGI